MAIQRPVAAASDDEEYAERPVRGRLAGVKKAAPVKAVAKKAPPLDDADDEPARPVKKAGAVKAGAKPTGLKGGWGQARKVMEASSPFAQSFQPGVHVVIIKFLEDEPYVSFNRHWIESTNEGGRGKINRPYTCPASPGIDKACPLCDVGDRAGSVAAFNIALVDDDGTVSLKTWDASPRVQKQLESNATDPKIGPLTKNFYAVKKTGKGGTASLMCNPVRESLLLEDYEVTPPTAEDLEAIGLYDATVVEVPKRSTLEELAVTLAEEDE